MDRLCIEGANRLSTASISRDNVGHPIKSPTDSMVRRPPFQADRRDTIRTRSPRVDGSILYSALKERGMGALISLVSKRYPPHAIYRLRAATARSTRDLSLSRSWLELASR